MYITDEVKRLNIHETSLTFDQPLYVKAEEIVTAEKLDVIIVRLGGFHTLMSVVGSAFHLMKGSGIESALNCIYGTNAIVHIMSGKAIARALRAIHLTDAALTYKLLEQIVPRSVLEDQNHERSSDAVADVELQNRLSVHTFNELARLLNESIVECKQPQRGSVVDQPPARGSIVEPQEGGSAVEPPEGGFVVEKIASSEALNELDKCLD